MSLRRSAAATAALAAILLLVLPSASFANALLALLAAAPVVWMLRRRREIEVPGGADERPAVGRTLLALPGLLSALLADAIRGTWRMAPIALGFRPPRGGGLVEVRLEEASRRGATLAGLATSLSPGAVLVELDPDGPTLLFHQVTSDDERFRRDVAAFYARQREVVP